VRRDEIVVLTDERDVLTASFQTINALGQEVGDDFDEIVGYSWEESSRLLSAANRVLRGGVGTSGSAGRPDAMVCVISARDDRGLMSIGVSLGAAELIRRCCAAALTHIEDWEFPIIVGAEIAEIQDVLRVLDATLRT
jgi:hypothetical protein